MSAPRIWITDLPLDTIDRERAAIFVAEFLEWWAQAGRLYYGPDGRDEDEGLQHIAADAIEIAGGLTHAQRIAAVTQEDTMEQREDMAAVEDARTEQPPPTTSAQGDGDSGQGATAAFVDTLTDAEVLGPPPIKPSPTIEYRSSRAVTERLTLLNVEHAFTYQPWTEDQRQRGHEVTAALVEAAKTVLRCVPGCPTRTRALNCLIDARMLANSAITHDGKY